MNGTDLMKTVVKQSKQLTKKMSDDTMLNKLTGNPIFEVNATMEERANPLNLFRNNGLPQDR